MGTQGGCASRIGARAPAGTCPSAAAERGEAKLLLLTLRLPSLSLSLSPAGEASPDARAAFLAETGAKSALPRIITVGYSQLNLIYFFTAGEKEVRCWTVQQGALAPQAAGVIHGDFERGFIKAETVAFEDFKALSTGPSMAEVKAGGKYRIEGKGYTVQAYDIMHFQFNVTTAKK